MRSFLLALLAAGSLVPSGLAQEEPPPGARAVRLESVPFPEKSELETAVAEHIREAELALLEILEQEQPDPKTVLGRYAELGSLYHAYELTEAGRVCYANAAALEPGQPHWPHLLGLLERQAGEAEAAEAAFRRTLEIQPANTPARIYLAELLLARNELDEAQEILDLARENSPDEVAVTATLGQLALAQGKPEEAVELLEEALARIPAANRLHYPLAQAYRSLGRMDEAREHLELRGKVGVRPADPLADRIAELARGERVYILRGRTAFQAGRYGEAAELFRKAVQARPDSVTALVNLGSALGQAGQAAEAVSAFRQALEHDPENATAHFNLGLLLLQAGDTEGARSHLNDAVRIQPEDPQTHLQLAQLERALGDSIKALHHFRSARKLAPTLEDAHLGEVSVLLDLGQLGDARERLEAAHAQMPDQGRTAHALARLLAASPDPALRDGEKALELALMVYAATEAADHAETVALALAEQGQCDRAAQWQRQILEAARKEGKEELVVRLGKDLQRYEEGEPCRLPPGAEPTADPAEETGGA